ncbi:hypothetical protein VNI00_001100 [Paramarasmius palmivorus]|uniref:Uncharacterized protein n=1 Tax=Paramarasmius palmivorus TaxID=297713 RepID=A0AAW0E5Y9_9AGAR
MIANSDHKATPVQQAQPLLQVPEEVVSAEETDTHSLITPHIPNSAHHGTHPSQNTTIAFLDQSEEASEIEHLSIITSVPDENGTSNAQQSLEANLPVSEPDTNRGEEATPRTSMHTACPDRMTLLHHEEVPSQYATRSPTPPKSFLNSTAPDIVTVSSQSSTSNPEPADSCIPFSCSANLLTTELPRPTNALTFSASYRNDSPQPEDVRLTLPESIALRALACPCPNATIETTSLPSNRSDLANLEGSELALHTSRYPTRQSSELVDVPIQLQPSQMDQQNLPLANPDTQHLFFTEDTETTTATNNESHATSSDQTDADIANLPSSSPPIELELLSSSPAEHITTTSSPPPSSPPRIFTSSPEPEPFIPIREVPNIVEEPVIPPSSSPPTSPFRSSSPLGIKDDFAGVYSDDLSLDIQSEPETSTSTRKEQRSERPSNELRQPTLPVPKRSTHASQKRSLKKLSTPFRTPAMLKVIKAEELPPTMASSTTPKPTPALAKEEIKIKKPAVVVDTKKKHRTLRAGGQFKSPLTTSTPLGTGSVRLTPNIQLLERKVQLLKRAVKVKRENEEEVLKGLIKTWTEAGREVAYELFELAKDREGSGSMVGGVRKFEDSWGWSEQEGPKKVKMEDSWGWAVPANGEGEGEVIDVDAEENERMVVQEDDDGEEKRENTIGMMLRQLGIDPYTLGWDDAEEAFVDR